MHVKTLMKNPEMLRTLAKQYMPFRKKKLKSLGIVRASFLPQGEENSTYLNMLKHRLAFYQLKNKSQYNFILRIVFIIIIENLILELRHHTKP